ncbi:hypothetical protein FB480_101222 [Agrobacterium vitis]|nr:hypothetical protein FB480_101222 [Agrobacterium vitis]
MTIAMKPMPRETSGHSRLKAHPYPFERQDIAGIIDAVDRRVRIMCRMMQLYQYDGHKCGDAEDEVSDLTMAMGVFYEYVDRQMDTLSALSEAIEGKGYVSLDMLGQDGNA